MNELSKILGEMISCGQGMISAAQDLIELLSAESEHKPVAQAAPVPSEPEVPKYSFTDVRKAFSDKVHAGFTDQIKALITSYGVDRLSAVKEEDYTRLMADLEALK